MKVIIEYRDTEKDLWVGKEERDSNYTKRLDYLFEGFIKVKDGLIHCVERCEKKMSILKIEKLCKENGIFTKRPYTAGQACDGSISAPVYALFSKLCKNYGLDPVKVYNEAYAENQEKFTDEKLRKIIKSGEWQGVRYPDKWDEKSIKLVYKSLHEINSHYLVQILEDKVEAARAG